MDFSALAAAETTVTANPIKSFTERYLTQRNGVNTNPQRQHSIYRCNRVLSAALIWDTRTT